MQIKYSSYLRHMNENHSPKTGQFISGDGDGDGITKDHKNQRSFNSTKASRISKTVSEGSRNLSSNLNSFSKKQNSRADLSNLSNKELNDILTRERMEQEYNRYFNSPQENKGINFVKTALDITATAAGIAATGFTIYSIVKK